MDQQELSGDRTSTYKIGYRNPTVDPGDNQWTKVHRRVRVDHHGCELRTHLGELITR
jgi:hypothetical protein